MSSSSLRTASQPLLARIAATRVLIAPNEGPCIGTHHGTFHADEVLACSMLRLLPETSNHDIVRTRDPDVLAKCRPVVDVGGVYDPSKQLYDHHQREFSDTMEGHGIRLSSAGLVYRHHGKQLIQQLCKDLGLTLDEAAVDTVYGRLYERLIKHVDAIDNGVPIAGADAKQLYRVTSDLSSRVARCNPRWNHPEQGPALENQQFVAAMLVAATELMEQVEVAVASWLPARSLTERAIEKGMGHFPSGQVLVLSQFAPWKDHLHELEEQRGTQGRALYVLFPDARCTWRIVAVPVEPDSFVSRKPLPKPWRGLRDEELSKLLGLPGCVFVHAGGFIGGHNTFEGAVEMARMALAAAE